MIGRIREAIYQGHKTWKWRHDTDILLRLQAEESRSLGGGVNWQSDAAHRARRLERARAALEDEEFPTRGLSDAQVMAHPELDHALFRAEERVTEQVDPWQL